MKHQVCQDRLEPLVESGFVLGAMNVIERFYRCVAVPKSQNDFPLW